MSKGLADTLVAIKESTNGDKISFGDIVKALNQRGLGALLIGPSLLMALPTGAIPGIPLICGLFIILIASQIAVGRRYPWIPDKLKSFSFERKKYENAVDKFKPYVEKIDSFFYPRFEFLTSNIVQRIVAIICVFLSALVIVLGVVPFAVTLPAITMLLFGLAISVHDGLLMAVGLFFMGLSAWVVPMLIGQHF